FRLIRAFKNRFGAVNELGVLAMTDRGLRGVSNPSALFVSKHDVQVAGSCVMATQEGTRPLLVEIQALVDAAHVPNPRRLSVGLDQQRLAMLLAVLHRHAGIAAYDQDVFVNAVGGVRIAEPAADLAVLLAIFSSMRDRPLPRGLVAFGEVGLAGEIRPPPRGQERLREAAKLGFAQAIIPRANAPKHRIEGLEVVTVDRLVQALEQLRGNEAAAELWTPAGPLVPLRTAASSVQGYSDAVQSPASASRGRTVDCEGRSRSGTQASVARRSMIARAASGVGRRGAQG